MNSLTLIRHAKSSWKDDGLPDMERPLNKRGFRNAPMMGARLRLRGVVFDRLYTSPALRARTTARLIATELGLDPAKIEIAPSLYTFNYEDLLGWVRSMDDVGEHIALVCHNPAITDFANFLALSDIENVPTCGIVTLSFAESGGDHIGAGSANLDDFCYPKLESDS